MSECKVKSYDGEWQDKKRLARQEEHITQQLQNNSYNIINYNNTYNLL